MSVWNVWYYNTMRGIYQRVLFWWRKCGDDDCDDDDDSGDVDNEDDGHVDNTVTENVRARLRNRNLTNERKFLLNFESRQIPCDIFANSLPGYFWSQFLPIFWQQRCAVSLRISSSLCADDLYSCRDVLQGKLCEKGLPSFNVDNLKRETNYGTKWAYWKVYAVQSLAKINFETNVYMKMKVEVL